MDTSRARLVQRIYEADDDDLRTSVLGGIATSLGAEGVHAMILGPMGLLESTDFTRYPSRAEEYVAHWQAHDPRFGVALARPGEVLSDVDHVDAATFERSEIYNDFLARIRIRYTLMVAASVAPGVTLAYAFMRPPEASAFAGRERGLLGGLMPHLHRAAQLRDRIRRARGAHDELARALDLLAAPTALVEADGTLVYANTAARILLDARDGVRVDRARLCATHPGDDRALQGAFARAALFADASVRVPAEHALVSQVLTRRNEGGPLCLGIYPMRPDNVLRGPARRARVLVSLHDPSSRPTLDATRVAERHGLTPTEARLAVALANGGTVATFAKDQGCTEQTARSHLKRVLEKTACRRQAELVRVVLALHRIRG